MFVFALYEYVNKSIIAVLMTVAPPVHTQKHTHIITHLQTYYLVQKQTFLSTQCSVIMIWLEIIFPYIYFFNGNVKLWQMKDS